MFLLRVIAISALLSFLLLWASMPFLRHWFLDSPNFRSSHGNPTPSAGGASFVLIALSANTLYLLSACCSHMSIVWVLFIASPLAFVGLFDDRFSLPISVRYFFQLLTAFVLIILMPLNISFWFIPFLLIVFTAIVNFANFMDGLDGLVAGCMLISISSLSFSLSAPWPFWSLIGSLIGFLFWNWSPAKIFMGDMGSTFLGAVFAGLVLQASSWVQALGYLLVVTPLLADAFFCVLRRLLDGQHVLKAHRLHLFQRLQQAGWPHARVSLTYISGTALLAVAMLVGGLPWVFGLAVAEMFLGVWLDLRVAVPFSVASKR